MQDFLRRTWAQINLDAIDNNISQIKNIISPGTKLCAVVKADCYGHGYAFTAQEMSAAGTDWFAVSNLAEAEQLRRAGIDKPVLILGYTPPEKAGELAYNDISQSVFSSSYASALSAVCRREGITVNAHIKIDTGMSRIGFVYHDSNGDYPSVDEIEKVCRLPGLNPEGVFTHFASADYPGGEMYTRIQYDLFLTAVGELEKRGISFHLRHCSNSAAILDYPEMNLDMVRAGVILYGLDPSPVMRRKINLLPVMELKTVVSMVKYLPPETPVSYGGTYVSDNGFLAATVPIGYADGYPRSGSNKLSMLVNGVRTPVRGNVCMDQTVIDISGAGDVKEGQLVTVFGADNGAYVSVDEIAEAAGTINYEIICGLSRRVPRVYIRNNEVISTTDYML